MRAYNHRIARHSLAHTALSQLERALSGFYKRASRRHTHGTRKLRPALSTRWLSVSRMSALAPHATSFLLKTGRTAHPRFAPLCIRYDSSPTP